MATDKTKYIFDNAEYGKGRLVLAVVKKYVAQYAPTYDELKNTFPSKLQGSVGVVISEKELTLRKANSNDSTERFFIKSSDAFMTSDGIQAYVSTEWGMPNINRFISKAEELGYHIDIVTSSLTVKLSDGAIKHGYIKIPSKQNLFDAQNFADNENDDSATLFSLVDDDGEEFDTCILKNRGRLKKRFGAYFKSKNIKPGTDVNFIKIDDGQYNMTFEADNKSIKELYEEYKSQPRRKWIANYKERSQQLSNYKDKDLSDYDTKLLKDIWSTPSNGVANVSPGFLSKVEFENLLPELPLITSKILNDPSPETWTEVNVWATKARDKGKFKTIKRGVINRVFCTANPQSYSTMLRKRLLLRLINKLNDLYDLDINTEGNWSELNADLLAKIKSQGLQAEDVFFVNTFVWDLYKKLVDHDNSETEIMIIEEDNTMPCKNIIYYGPPGTGKTYKLQQLLKEKYTDNQILLDLSLWLNSKLGELGWLDIITLILLDSDVPMKVADITSHKYYKVKAKINERDANLRATAWSALQSHAVLDSKTVNYSGRREPSIFDKNEDSSWYIVDNQLDQLDEYRNKLAELKSGPIEKETIKRYDFVTFHQSYGYEEFIEGLRPSVTEDGDISYEIKQGVFKRICKQAEADPDNQYAMVIDEINRGNISKIFGELITLVEADKRSGQENELTVTLPYSGLPFSVPSNIDIIGTMNTADRSLTHIDVALRRRFDFKELRTDYSLISDDVDGINMRWMLYAINQRIELLLDREHILGHAILMNVNSLASLSHTFKSNIMPLLEEYFFENWGKINQVLNCNGFVEELKEAASTWLGDSDDYAAKSFRVNLNALNNIKNYTKIYSEIDLSAFDDCEMVSE